MLELTYKHMIGIVFTLGVITFVAIYSGSKVKSSSDFSVGGKKSGRGIIAGTIMGTLVGGAATIGTAQLAFLYGFSAWWFTLGGGIGCILLAIFFVKPLYKSDKETVPQILSAEYGLMARPISSIFVSIGIFINIIAQVLAAIALLTSMFNISTMVASIIAIVLMSAYVIFGGVIGAGLVGITKLIFLYISAMVGGIIAIKMGGGFGEFLSFFPREQYFSLIARGAGVDLAAGFSLVLGVLSTQTYIQAVFSAKSIKEARMGAVISGVLTPLIGVAGIFIGLFMRMNHPDLNPASAFPEFVLQYMNPWFAGIVLATLLITIVGTGAGLSLGICTIFTKDIYKIYMKKDADDNKQLKVSRIVIIVTLVLALLFTTGNAKSLILQWSFMSMGLRGATVFLPLCGALFLKGKLKKSHAVTAMVIGPASMIIGNLFLPESFNPLFLGVITSAIIIIFGLIEGNIKKFKFSKINRMQEFIRR